jgi:hypothetical protein
MMRAVMLIAAASALTALLAGCFGPPPVLASS